MRKSRVRQRFVVVWVLCCLVFAGSVAAVKYWPDTVPAGERIQAGPQGNFKLTTSVGEVVVICSNGARIFLTPTGGIAAVEDKTCVTR